MENQGQFLSGERNYGFIYYKGEFALIVLFKVLRLKTSEKEKLYAS